MTDIVLPPLANMQTAALLNNNLQKIQDAINNDVVHRSGGNNTMNQDLDMNSNNLLNVATDPNDPNSLARIQDLGDYKAAAAQSATDAANSAADAANSAQDAANDAAAARDAAQAAEAAAGAVDSVFGRTGTVTAQSGDYTFSQIGGKPTTLAGYGITDAVAEKGQTTNLNALVGSCVFGFADTATGAPNAGFSYDATGVQWAETGQTTQLVSLAPGKGEQLLIRVDDGSGFSDWSAVLTDLNSGDFATAAQGALADSAVQPNTSPTFAGTVVITGGSAAGGGHLDLAGGSDYKIRMNSNLFLHASSSNWGFWNDSAAAWDIKIGYAAPDVTVRGRVLPINDNSLTCGASGLRWSVVYAATGSINTSDAREKTEVAPLSPAELAAAADLARAIGTYQWLASIAEKGDDAARHHAGLTVQRAIQIMQDHGLDPFRYGFICYDEWPEQLEKRDPETDKVEQEYQPAGDRYSFRTDELLLFIARGAAAERDAQAQLIADLTARLTALEAA